MFWGDLLGFLFGWFFGEEEKGGWCFVWLVWVMLVVLLICDELQSKTVLAFYISHCPPPQQGNSLTVFSLLTLAVRDIFNVSCSLKPPRTVLFFFNFI